MSDRRLHPRAMRPTPSRRQEESMRSARAVLPRVVRSAFAAIGTLWSLICKAKSVAASSARRHNIHAAGMAALVLITAAPLLPGVSTRVIFAHERNDDDSTGDDDRDEPDHDSDSREVRECREVRHALLAARGRRHQGVRLGHFTLVDARPAPGQLIDCAVRAEVRNRHQDGALDGLAVTARLTSDSLALRVRDDTVSFGVVPSRGRAISADTFAVRRDPHRPLHPRDLAWAISGASDLAVRPSWVGAWHITLTYRKAATGAVTAVEETDGVIRPDEPFGLAFSGLLATCTGSLTDTALTLHCALNPIPEAPCSVSATLE